MSKLYPVLSLALFACTEAPTSSEEISQMEQAVCANVDGVPSAMAALAVATATELGRWQPAQDFQWKRALLALTPAAKRRCADGRCWNTQAILDLQLAPAGLVTIGGELFDGERFRLELRDNFREQLRCESDNARRDGATCRAENHELVLDSVSSGACDTLYTFHATSPNGSPLRRPEWLANKLIYVGYPENEYLSFTSTSNTVSIDPTYGLNPGSGTNTGSCSAACVKLSETNISGDCCSCSGVVRSFVRSAFSTTTYICM